ncbi:uncharacterized protein LOC126292300 isoform X3 [Schistocerca gregaria]|nr:uncharacterized protein LOC126292300 isoform X3 [Schistocerca gregaria]
MSDCGVQLVTCTVNGRVWARTALGVPLSSVCETLQGKSAENMFQHLSTAVLDNLQMVIRCVLGIEIQMPEIPVPPDWLQPSQDHNCGSLTDSIGFCDVAASGHAVRHISRALQWHHNL